MKIAIVGPEATGRTVLAKGLAAELGLPLIGDSRDDLLRDSGYPTLFEWGKATGEWQAWLASHASAESKATSGVVDAGSIDVFAQIFRWASDGISPDRLDQLEQHTRRATASYSHVVLTAPVIVAPHAPSRFRSANNARQMHQLLRGLIADFASRARVLELEPAEELTSRARSVAFVRGAG